MAGNELAAVCGDCGEPVTASTVGEHMDQHGRLLPDDWNLAAWPDGTAVILDWFPHSCECGGVICICKNWPKREGR